MKDDIDLEMNVKEELIKDGYRFPCDGRGICGKCKIRLAPNFKITEFDRRHIDPLDLARGYRLACDKVVSNKAEILEYLLPSNTNIKKPEQPSVGVVIKENTIEIAFVDSNILESKVLNVKAQDTRDLRSIISKNLIEFFEKYNVPKAVTILIASSKQIIELFKNDSSPSKPFGEFYNAAIFDMPAEDVYIVGTPNEVIGGAELLEAADLEIGELLVLEDTGIFILNADTSFICAQTKFDQTIEFSDQIKRVFIKAAFSYFVSEFNVSKSRIISSASQENKLSHEGVKAVIKPSNTLKYSMLALTSNAYKTKLNKIAKKIVLIDLISEKLFHDILAVEYNHTI
jgi:uncharacterized 2Fe-2S/4Fe-4S cluster protein (DUF4445 family)